MRINGTWHTCDDGEFRPVLLGAMAAADGRWLSVPLVSRDVGDQETQRLPGDFQPKIDRFDAGLASRQSVVDLKEANLVRGNSFGKWDHTGHVAANSRTWVRSRWRIGRSWNGKTVATATVSPVSVMNSTS